MIHPLRRLGLLACVTFFALAYANESSGQGTTDEIHQLYEAAFALEKGDLDSTMQLATEIRNRSEAIKYNKGIILSKLLTSFVYLGQYKLDSARLLLDQCLAYFEDNPSEKNTIDHGRAYLYAGLVELRDHELQIAKTNAISALLIFNSLKDPKYIANTHTLMGAIELAVTNYHLALEHFMDAYKIKTESGEPPENCQTEIYNISIVYARTGQQEDALKFTFKSLAIARKLNDVMAIVNSLNGIGSIHSNAGHTDSAYHYFMKAKTAADSAGLSHMVFVAEYNLANMYSNTGRYQEAMLITDRLLRQSAELPVSSVEMLKMLMAKNHLRQQYYDAAIRTARPLFQNAIVKGNKQSMISLSDILWNAYREKRQFDSSFYFLLKHSSVKDSVYNLENQQKLSTLYAELETIEKQAAINNLEKDQLIRQSEYENLVMLFTLGSLVMTLLVVSIVMASKNRERKQRLLNLELQNELEKNKKALHQQALRILYINNGLAEAEQNLKRIKTKLSNGKQQEVQQIINTIHLNKSLEKEWDNFNAYFSNVHGGFIKTINETYPELTTAEKRLASLIKMDLTNKEIASILNIEPSSVKMAKYRLKRKLALAEDQDIHMYFQSIA